MFQPRKWYDCFLFKKAKVNTRSSTESELIDVDDIISKIIWLKNFIEAQGVKVNKNVIY